jgi:hypothetical protein
MLFALLNFSVQSINVLPNYVGYLLAAIGLYELRNEGPPFRRLSLLTYVLLAWSYLGLSVPAFRWPPVLGSGQALYSTSAAPHPIPPAFIATLWLLYIGLQGLWVYWLGQGLKRLAGKGDVPKLLDGVRRSWILYLVSIVLLLVSLFFEVVLASSFVPLEITFFMLRFIVTVLFVALFYGFAREMGEP